MFEQTLDEFVEVLPESDGTIDLRIPAKQLWDCVECLSEHRLNATFTFKESEFVARLPHVPLNHAREILHAWHVADAMDSPSKATGVN